MTSSFTLLCLNSEETHLFIRKLVLEEEGFRVLTATTAKDALKIIEREKVDLVIVDHLLGDTTGINVARKIKVLRPQVPIILLSGFYEPPEYGSEIDAFVCKADGREALFVAIQRLLGRVPKRSAA